MTWLKRQWAKVRNCLSNESFSIFLYLFLNQKYRLLSGSTANTHYLHFSHPKNEQHVSGQTRTQTSQRTTMDNRGAVNQTAKCTQRKAKNDDVCLKNRRNSLGNQTNTQTKNSSKQAKKQNKNTSGW